MTGKDLIEVINENKLQDFPIKDTLLLLLEKKMIRPSEIIDVYGEYLNKMVHVYDITALKAHYFSGGMKTQTDVSRYSI